MKIALAQMEVIPGRIDRNIRKMIDMIGQAKREGVGLIVFPELCISGYILSDLWVNDAFCDALMQCNRVLSEASDNITIVYGNIYVDNDTGSRWNNASPHPNKDGRSRKYNAAYCVKDGRPARRRKDSNILPGGVQPKTLLPQYRIFDDERYFFSLQDVAKDAGVPIQSLAQPFVLDCNGQEVLIGCEVCEDLWCNDYRMSGQALNITNMLIDNGATLIANISASPWNFGKNVARDNRIAFLKEQAGEKFVPFLYVNHVGAQNNGKNIVTFDGGTTIYNRHGQPVLMADQSYQEQLISFHDSIFDTPPVIRRDEPKISRKLDAIVAGIKHMVLFKPEFSPLQFVIGLSGGIDSAVVASLLTLACGNKNVIALNMPSVHNAPKTKETAKLITQRLGIALHIVPVDDWILPHHRFREYDKLYNPPQDVRSLSDENVQAKIRGTSILSNFAARYSRFFTCNGNKIEIALGYSTLYGDVNGALAPIGDLTKTEVYALGHFLNEEVFREEIIPPVLFPDELFSFDRDWIIPSPELKTDQVDPIRFGYHDALLEALTDYIRKSPEDMLQWYLDGTLGQKLGIDTRLIKRWGLDDPKVFTADLEWFVSTIQKNIFKRVQAPPIIITSRSAYGYDIRESMLPFYKTERYQRLEGKVLSLHRYAPAATT